MQLAAVRDRPGQPVITAEIPVTPAAPTPPRLARRAWVEQVMGMPVSVHVRGRGADPAEAWRPGWPGPSHTCARSTRCSAPGAPTATSCVARGELRVEDAHPLGRRRHRALPRGGGARPAGCSRAPGRPRRRPARLRPDRAGQGLGGAARRGAPRRRARTVASASARAATSPSAPGGRRRGAVVAGRHRGPAPPGAVATVCHGAKGRRRDLRCAARGRHVVDPRTGRASPPGVGHGGGPGAALGRRLGDCRLGRPRPCGATDGRARPRLQPPRPLTAARVKKPRRTCSDEPQN